MEQSNKSCWVILLTFLLMGHSALGQFSISGKVGERAAEPMPFANVLLLNGTDSVLIKGMLARENGTYVFENVKAGQYRVAASMVGYGKSFSPAFSVPFSENGSKEVNLVLSGGSTALKEVKVVGQKPLFEQQLDRLVVNVQGSIVSAGATALEVLERSPGITVNRQSSTMSIAGKDGVIVMINGKQNRVPISALIQMLGGMNAGNIEKIEIITTPSAQYDAEGNAGIINLVLKKNENFGTNGAYSLTLGYGWYEKPSGTFNLNHRTEKLNLYTDYSFFRDHSYNRIKNTRQVSYEGEILQTSSVNRREPVTTNHTARVGFDYTFSGKTTLSGLVSGFSDRWSTGPKEERGASQTLRNGVLESGVRSTHVEENHWRHIMGNLSFNHKLTQTQEFSLDTDLLFYHDRNPHEYTNAYTFYSPAEVREEKLTMEKTTPIHLWVSKADYRNKLSENTTLEAGLKATLSELENEVAVQDNRDGVWTPNAEFSQHIRMLEDIGAAYVNFSHLLPFKVKLQTGLRYEYTHTDLSTIEGTPIVNRRYGNLFPSIFVSRDLTKKSSLQVSYSRRIMRPTYDNLAPFVYFIDPNTFLSGNTNLKPTITDALQTTYRFHDRFLVTLGYSYDHTPIIDWQMHLDSATNKQYARAENLKHRRNYSLTLSLPFNPTGWWQIQSNFLATWINNTGLYDGKEITLNSGFANVNLNQTFKLPKSFTAEVSGSYQTRTPFGISYINPFGSLNAGVQKELPDEKGVFRLSINDIFWTDRFKLLSDVKELNLYSSFSGVFSDPRIVRLTYSRNFGNRKMKVATRRETSSEEERKRAKN
ncbi:outer membrane beta-barrel family protein [Rufibacter hautae]|uniref:TonB-dependent receptor n=1 Tax=Rufibacter hautae TaxID=2595005 RepID=A0A5B6TBV9_9BACT|nr:outer membrane beta-barrel family protein [Rufibacter hautae]KAA3437636.1 TonB-dependent receptor [Rufibacter hautae]